MAAIQNGEHHIDNAFNAVNLVQSYEYELKTWRFPQPHAQQLRGYNDCFCIILVQRGKFQLDISRTSHLPHTGHVIIDKPDSEYALTAAGGACTIISFTSEFFARLLEEVDPAAGSILMNRNILSLMLRATAETEYFHYRLINAGTATSRLEVDTLVFEMLNHVMDLVGNRNEILRPERTDHLRAVELAKEYMNANFESNMSLAAIAAHACLSAFHFLRVFKSFTSYTPYKYLMNIRLKHAELLLRNTCLPIADVSLASGFRTTEHFATAFRHRYKLSPTQYRHL